MDIIIDFDGTCVTHEFPQVGKDIGAAPILKQLVKNGHRLILFTMRSDVEKPVSNDPDIVCEKGDYLTQAVRWFNDNNIHLYGIQKNPTQHTWTHSPKAYGQLIIDDAALGCPLRLDLSISKRPYVCWSAISTYLINAGLLNNQHGKS